MKKLLFTHCFIFLGLFLTKGADQQFRSPNASISMNRYSELNWSDCINSFESDNQYMKVRANYIGQMSNYIVLTDFNYEIPENSVISGIELSIERSALGMTQEVKDLEIRLTHGGTLVGSNVAKRENWSYNDETVVYGGRMDTWNTDFSALDISSVDFGVAISVQLDGSEVLPIAHIDHVEMTIYYSTALPVKMLTFSANRINKEITQLNWTTASEINNDFFSVEQSNDANYWNEIGKVYGNGNSTAVNSYEFSDINTSSTWTYYRLKQVDFNGAFEYSNIAAVKGSDIVLIKDVYPNPTRGNINVKTTPEVVQVSVYDSRGILIIQENLNGESLSSFNLDNAHKGLGFIQVVTANGSNSIEKFIYE